jgi:hypothetical protein
MKSVILHIPLLIASTAALGAAVVLDAPGHAAVKARGGDGEVNNMPCTP